MAKLRDESAALPALRLVLRKQAVPLQPVVNQVSALPADAQLEYYFVPVQFMEQYRPYYRPGQPFKNLKLVNFGHPAISLSFYFKHKYKIERQPAPDQVLQHLTNYRAELLNRSLTEQISPVQKNELVKVDDLTRSFRKDADAFQACFSNYYHYYRYWYCSYRFFEDEEQTQVGSGTEHLLKHTERVVGQVHERLNIIFIDRDSISRPVPRDDKLIDRELDTYPTEIRQGLTTLYLKRIAPE